MPELAPEEWPPLAAVLTPELLAATVDSLVPELAPAEWPPVAPTLPDEPVVVPVAVEPVPTEAAVVEPGPVVFALPVVLLVVLLAGYVS